MKFFHKIKDDIEMIPALIWLALVWFSLEKKVIGETP